MRLEMAKQPENRVQMPIREMDEHNAKVKERSVAIPVAVDDEGDLILWTKTKGVRVSSKVLSVASPVFKAMFNYYRIAPEGSSNEPYSMSVDADGNALEELCQVLHHKPPAVSTDIEKLVQFAKVCQKYQCIMAGKPRTELCLPNFSSLRRLGSEDCVKVLYIISEFGMEGQFATTVSRVASLTAPGAATVPSMPEGMKTKQIVAHSQAMIQTMSDNLSSTLNALRYNFQRFPMRSQYCDVCLKDKPLEAQRCRPCKNNGVVTSFICDRSRRIGDFLVMLQDHRLSQFNTGEPPLHFADRADIAKLINPDYHDCDGGSECPMWVAFVKFRDDIRTTVARPAPLTLKQFRTLGG